MIKKLITLLLPIILFSNCSENEKNTYEENLKEKITENLDYIKFTEKYNIALNINESAEYKKNEDSWVIQIKSLNKNGNLFLLSNGKSFYQDLSNENEIKNYYINYDNVITYKLDENNQIKGTDALYRNEPCTIGYAAGCAALGIVGGGGGTPFAVFIFGACMLTCD